MDFINSVDKDGFSHVPDSLVGSQFRSLLQEKSRLDSERGIIFCLSNSIGKTVYFNLSSLADMILIPYIVYPLSSQGFLFQVQPGHLQDIGIRSRTCL